MQKNADVEKHWAIDSATTNKPNSPEAQAICYQIFIVWYENYCWEISHISHKPFRIS